MFVLVMKSRILGRRHQLRGVQRSIHQLNPLASKVQTKTKTSAVGRKKNSEVKSPPSITTHDLASSSEKPKVSLKQVLSKSKELNSSAKQASSLNPKLSSPDASRVLGSRRNSDINIKQSKGPPK
ncbi:hypothetical protein NC651_011080 [Populus alba x Populus x berolinensis]|nr:hypothetical protein NC651_011080 [Populus alba x Populus x berolinensis]